VENCGPRVDNKTDVASLNDRQNKAEWNQMRKVRKQHSSHKLHYHHKWPTI